MASPCRLLGEHGIPKDSVGGRREFALQMEQRRRQEAEADYRQIRLFREVGVSNGSLNENWVAADGQSRRHPPSEAGIRVVWTLSQGTRAGIV